MRRTRIHRELGCNQPTLSLVRKVGAVIVEVKHIARVSLYT